MYLSTILTDIKFPETFSCTNKQDVLTFFLEINKMAVSMMSKNLNLFKDAFPELYIDFLTWSFPEEWPFGRKLYHYLCDDKDLSLAKCKRCQGWIKWRRFHEGYRNTFCSRKCALNDPDARLKNKILWENKSREEIERSNQ